jgi:hypothetical protein
MNADVISSGGRGSTVLRWEFIYIKELGSCHYGGTFEQRPG